VTNSEQTGNAETEATAEIGTSDVAENSLACPEASDDDPYADNVDYDPVQDDDYECNPGMAEYFAAMEVKSTPDPILDKIDKKYDENDEWSPFPEYMIALGRHLRTLNLSPTGDYKDVRRESLIWIGKYKSILRSFLFPCTLQGVSNTARYHKTRSPTISNDYAELHRNLFSELIRSFVSGHYAEPYTNDADANQAIEAITPILVKAYHAFLQDEFRIDQNPVHAWQAYSASRKHSVPMPEWASVYFDDCTKAIDEFIRLPPKQLGLDISKGLKFSYDDSVPGSTLSRENKRRRLVACFCYFTALLDQDLNLTDAKVKTQDYLKVSPQIINDSIEFFTILLPERIGRNKHTKPIWNRQDALIDPNDLIKRLKYLEYTKTDKPVTRTPGRPRKQN